MSVSLLTAEELMGLFELDGSGTVLYHRSDPDGERRGTAPDMAGHNFYDEVAPFQNVEDFRRCVTEFTTGVKAVDSFDFDCRYEGADHPIRVLLARIFEQVDQSNTKSVLMHIRRGNTHEKTQKAQVMV